MILKIMEIKLEPKNFKGKQCSDINISHMEKLVVYDKKVNNNADTFCLLMNF